MGSKTSKTKSSTSTNAEAVTIPGILQDTVPKPPRDTVPLSLQDTVPLSSQDIVSLSPQDTVPVIPRDTLPTIPHDIIIEILDHLASNSDLRSLRACALVSKPWVQRCQRHLFHTTCFTPNNASKWLMMFPEQGGSPAHYVRDLCLEIGQDPRIPEKFFKCISWFTGVDKMSFLGRGGIQLGYGGFSPLREPSFWNVPRSVTSLTINTGAVTLVQVRDIMAQLPNLDNLAVSGSLANVDRRKLLGIGTVLKGRFGGRLMLRGACDGGDIVNMLLEVPSGLHFTELEIYCSQDYLPSAVRLAEACCKTIVKLSHTVNLNYPNHQDIFERSFNFSKSPNVQEVIFGFRPGWSGEDMPWIPMALSTLGPTSPRLSVVKLDFTSSTGQPIETMVADMGNMLRQIADEIARLEREFKGRVNITVVPDTKFQAVFGALNILQHRIH